MRNIIRQIEEAARKELHVSKRKKVDRIEIREIEKEDYDNCVEYTGLVFIFFKSGNVAIETSGFEYNIFDDKTKEFMFQAHKDFNIPSIWFNDETWEQMDAENLHWEQMIEELIVPCTYL